MQLENCEPTEIIEMWWDDSHDQNMMIEVCKKDRKGRRGRGVALYLKRYIECKELPLRNSHEQVESLWVKVRDWTSKGHLVDKAFLLQLQEVLTGSHLLGDFNHLLGCVLEKQHSSLQAVQ